MFILAPTVWADNITIDNTTLIQDSVDSADTDDIIYLTPGTYKEAGIEIDKNITLQGLGNAKDIIIDGEFKDSIILINSRSKVVFNNITFINGNSQDYGGAIHSELGGQVYVTNCIFFNNTARENGGAIDIAGKYHINPKKFYKGFLNATNCTFLNNTAYHDGGAIATIYGDSYIYDSTFKYNYADRDGGAIRLGVITTTSTINCTFEENTAKEWGGALYNWLSELTVTDSVINNNTAGTRGGAIFSSGEVNAKHNAIINNNAEIGGVIYIHQEIQQIVPTITFSYNDIFGNNAEIGKLVYAVQFDSTKSNFDNNNWGDSNPNSESWESEFVTNGYFKNPTKWIENTINPDKIPKASPPEEETSIVKEDNITSYEKTSHKAEEKNLIDIKKEQYPSNETIADEDVIYSNSTQSNVGDYNSEIGKNNPKASEIIKKDVIKQINSNPQYLFIILLFLIILIYGYYRFKKNDS